MKRRLHMHIHGIFLGVAIGFLVAPPGTLGAQSVGQPDAEFFYYSSREGKLPLALSTALIGIRFEQGLSEYDKGAIVDSERDLGVFDQRLQLAVLQKEGMNVIPVKSGTSKSTVLEIIDRLTATAGVEFGSPVFEVQPGYPELLTDEFYASFPAGIPETDILALNERHAVEVIRKKDYTIIGKIGYRLRVTAESAMNALQMANLYAVAIADLHYAEPLTVGSNPNFLPLYSVIDTTSPNDTHYSSQWNLNNTGQQIQGETCDINAPEAWDTSTGISSTTIAILDTGVDLDHEDLDAKIVSGYDFVNDNNDPDDDHGHGTCCAGIAAAETNNSQGVAGVDWNCKIMPVKVANWQGSVTYANAADGIEYAADHGADVLSNSYGFTNHNQDLQDAVEYARENGCVIVASSGNDDINALKYPARYPEVIAVGATNLCDERKREVNDECNASEWWWGSNYGSQLDVVAPGVKIYATDREGAPGWDNGNYFDSFNGTSAACPQVAGLASPICSIIDL